MLYKTSCIATLATALSLLVPEHTLRAETWMLLPQAQVGGSGIFLDQLIAGGETNAQFHVRLADAPAAGRTLQMPLAQLRPLIAAAAPAWSSMSWTGAPTVQITRRMRMLPAAEILQALSDHLRKELVRDQGELELRFVRPWAPTPIADEPYTLRIPDLPVSGLTPNFHLRFELITESETLGAWQTPMEARLWREIWMCQQPLKRGATVQAADVSRERRDALKLPRDLIPVSFDPQEEWQMAENLNPGQPILRRSVQAKIILQKGQMVDALLKDGTLSIAIKAEVLDNGAPGQIIRIRNPNSRRELRGKVINEQTVLLLL